MPESNRQPAACAAALPLSQCRLAETSRPGSGMRHGSAARTGRDANPYRWRPFDRCLASPAVADRQSVCPCASRRRPHRASRCSACAPRGGTPRQRRPARGPRCPCVRAVMLRKCFGWKRVDEKRVGETVRAAKHRARVRELSFADAETKNAPGNGSEGVRGPRRSGRPISVTGSVVVVDGALRQSRLHAIRHACEPVALLARGIVTAMEAGGGRHRNGSKQGIFDAVVLRWARTLHPSFSLCKHFFHIRPPCRRTARAHCSSGSSARHTWSRSLGCAPALGCRRSAWNAVSSAATGSSRNGRNAICFCFARSANSVSKPCV